MEDVLELYGSEYDALRPVVCLDEKGKELCKTPKGELAMKKGQPKRVDYEYQHEGSCNLFVAYQPHQGFRQVWVTARRQAQDIAAVFKTLVDQIYPQAEVIRVVCDNLNIHNAASLYAAYPPQEARRLARKLEFHYTPTHASWLNMVEIELAVLEEQLLAERFEALQTVSGAVAAWQARRNRAQAKIDWQFSCTKARAKFQRFYPSLS